MNLWMRTCRILTVTPLAVLLLFSADVRGLCGDAASTAFERTIPAVNFRNDMRKLWEDHVFYTRLVIISVDGDQKDLNPALDKLMQNQVDIGNAIKPYYGDAAGKQLTTLLKDHIKTVGELFTAAKAGDTAKVDDAKTRWYASGDQIAAFLTSANPQYWPPSATKSLVKKYLDTTVDETAARFKGDYKADIAAFDKANQHILTVADTLSLGIIRQFPERFQEDPAAVVSIVDNQFDPQIIRVVPGMVITWTNGGNLAHTVSADSENGLLDGPDSDTRFPNGLPSGAKFKWTVPANAKPGYTWFYHCRFRGTGGDGSNCGGGMSGAITVR